MNHEAGIIAGSAARPELAALRAIFITAALMLSTPGCASSPEARPGEPFSIRPSEAVAVKDCGSSLRLLRVENDSRCPKGVNCIWEGDAEVVIAVEGADVESPVRLHWNESSGVRRVSLANDCSLELVELMPATTQQGPPEQEAYVVTLLVRKGSPE